MYLLGFTLAITPIIGMICFSISLSFGPVALLSSIPILLPLDYVGTALGIVKSNLNIGSTIYDILVGLLQDLDGGEYDMVMILYLGSSIFVVIVSICLFIVSKTWYDGILDMKDDERKGYFEEKRKRHDHHQNGEERHDENHVIMKYEERNRPAIRKYFYVGSFIFLLILSWILFFIFVL